MIRRGWSGLVLGAIVAIVLTGCTRSLMTVTIGDDTVSGSIVMAVKEDLLTVEDGDTIEDAADRWFADLHDDPTADLPGSVTVDDYRADGYIGRRAELSAATFAEVEERFSGYELTIDRDGDRFRFGMVVDLLDHPQLDDEMRRDMEIVVAVTMPGDVVDANGEIDGSTVTWTVDGAVVTALEASSTRPPVEEGPSTSEPVAAAPDDEPGRSAVPWIIVGSVLVAAAIAVLIVLQRRRAAIASRVDLDRTQEIRVVRIDDPPPR